MNPLIQLKQTNSVFLITLLLVSFGFLSAAQAVCQEGCLTNQNTALGENALLSNTSGFGNTANGYWALYFNTAGSDNTASGVQALCLNTTGNSNTATGNTALQSNTTGNGNTATGDRALLLNITGSGNTATGGSALLNNSVGSFNTATGGGALHFNTTGNYNTASGVDALALNTTGNKNVALGFQAGVNLTTGSDNIDIGANVGGVAGESGTIRIGTQGTQTGAYIAGISGTSLARSTAVVVDANGRLGTRSSSARFKKDIKPMDKGSEVIYALKPVTFRYKKGIDPEGTPQFGLVAEEVGKVNRDLVVRDAEGKVYTVLYDAVNAMLLNEFLKEHAKVQELEATIAKQQKDFQATATHQQKQIEALTAGLQKVSTQLEASKPALHVVNNP